MRPIIVPLGGFLGSGKTTLILAASRVLEGRGVRVAAILNDQGNNLVDTEFVSANGIAADQVTGGCFCCRFSELIDAAERLRAWSPDVIFAEAVGSCTDISATTLQPLKLYYSQQFRLAPYTVLMDPERAHELGRTHDWVFLYFDGRGVERQGTVITAQRGPLRGLRIVRGREEECLDHYARGGRLAAIHH